MSVALVGDHMEGKRAMVEGLLVSAPKSGSGRKNHEQISTRECRGHSMVKKCDFHQLKYLLW